MELQNWWFTRLTDTKEEVIPPLQKNIKTDVVIEGTGAVCISTAYALKKKGSLRFTLLEKIIAQHPYKAWN